MTRWVVALLCLVLLAAPVAAEAQPAGKLWRIGYLDQGPASRNKAYVEALRQGLRDLGWVEGQNITIEARFAEEETGQLPYSRPSSSA